MVTHLFFVINYFYQLIFNYNNQFLYSNIVNNINYFIFYCFPGLHRKTVSENNSRYHKKLS